MNIESPEQLNEWYDSPSGRAKDKVFSKLDKHAVYFIQHAPFVVLSTFSSRGNVDSSPRGGSPGFVQIQSSQEIVIPDAKGNNRIDSLKNIVETKRIGMLFLIPGIEETLRVNGSAYITTDNDYINLFSNERITPKTCVVIHIEEVFLHCAKALMRSKLWLPESQISRPSFPTMGQMLNDQLGGKSKPETQEEMIARYKKDL